MNNSKLAQFAIYAVIAIVIIVTAFIIWKKSGKFVKNKLTEAQQERQLDQEINEEEVSLLGTEMNNLVAKLKEAFGSYGYATDEDAVYDVFESLNSLSDLLSLKRAFSVYEDHTLDEWMNKELSASELRHVQEILSTKGIIYAF